MARNWCKQLAKVSRSAESRTPQKLDNNTFLIWGDRVLAGIPSHLIRATRTLERLTLFTPNKTQIANWKEKMNLVIQKRSIKEFNENCDTEIIHWARTKRAAVSIFLCWVAAAKALGELGHPERWMAIQANQPLLATSYLTRKSPSRLPYKIGWPSTSCCC